jgi:hypothetical protein
MFHEEAGLNVRQVDLEKEGTGRVLTSLGLTLTHNHPKVCPRRYPRNAPTYTLQEPMKVAGPLHHPPSPLPS